MRSAKELRGVAIVDVTGGRRLGRIEEVVVSPDDLRLLGFVIKEGNLLKQRELIIRAGHVRSIGADAVTVEGDVAQDASQQDEAFAEARSGSRPVLGAKAVTEDGTALGEIDDLSLDESEMRVAAVTLRGGLMGSGDAISADRIASVGPDMVVVRDEAQPAPASPDTESRSERDIRP
jgi:uncharacterized protein YrrD